MGKDQKAPDWVEIPAQPYGEIKERVAYNLMQQVYVWEKDIAPKDRSYWLKLYAECLAVVNGEAPN